MVLFVSRSRAEKLINNACMVYGKIAPRLGNLVSTVLGVFLILYGLEGIRLMSIAGNWQIESPWLGQVVIFGSLGTMLLLFQLPIFSDPGKIEFRKKFGTALFIFLFLLLLLGILSKLAARSRFYEACDQSGGIIRKSHWRGIGRCITGDSSMSFREWAGVPNMTW